MKGYTNQVAQIIQHNTSASLHQLKHILSSANPGEHNHEKKKWKAECDRQLKELQTARNKPPAF